MFRVGARWAFGGLLILLGLKNAFFPHPYAPVGIAEDLGYYGASLTMILIGLWLIVRVRRKKRVLGDNNS